MYQNCTGKKQTNTCMEFNYEYVDEKNVIRKKQQL